MNLSVGRNKTVRLVHNLWESNLEINFDILYIPCFYKIKHAYSVDFESSEGFCLLSKPTQGWN